MALFDYGEIVAIASDDSLPVVVQMNPETRQLLLACFGLLSNPRNWTDVESGLTASEEDDVDAMVSKAMEELLTEYEAVETSYVKFTAISQATQTTTTDVDMLASVTLAGDRNFPANYDYTIGETLTFTTWFTVNTNVSRNMTFNPITLDIGGSAFTLTLPVEAARVKIETVGTITDVFEVSGRPKATVSILTYAYLFRENAEIQRHQMSTLSGEIFTDESRQYRIGAVWSAAGGASSAITLRSSTLHVSRIYTP